MVVNMNKNILIYITFIVFAVLVLNGCSTGMAYMTNVTNETMPDRSGEVDKTEVLP